MKRKGTDWQPSAPYGAKAGPKKRTVSAPRKKYGQKNTIEKLYNNENLNRTPGPELKICDLYTVSLVDAYPVGNALVNGGVTHLNPITMGNGGWQRDGQRCNMKSVQIKMAISPTNTNTAALGYSMCRVAVVYDKYSNGSPSVPAVKPTITEIYAASSASNGTPSTIALPMAPLNITNRKRFIVLADQVFQLPALGINGAVAPGNVCSFRPSDLIFERFIKLRDLPNIYKIDSQSGLTADTKNGALYLVVFNDDPTVTAPAWGFKFSSRVKFTG